MGSIYFVETLAQKTDVTELWKTTKGIDGKANRDTDNKQLPSMVARAHRPSSLPQCSTNSSTRQSW